MTFKKRLEAIQKEAEQLGIKVYTSNLPVLDWDNNTAKYLGYTFVLSESYKLNIVGVYTQFLGATVAEVEEKGMKFVDQLLHKFILPLIPASSEMQILGHILMCYTGMNARSGDQYLENLKPILKRSEDYQKLLYTLRTIETFNGLVEYIDARI